MGARKEEVDRVPGKLGTQWRLPDIQDHVEGSQCAIGVGNISVGLSGSPQVIVERDVLVCIRNLLRVHPTCKEEEQSCNTDKKQSTWDVWGQTNVIVYCRHDPQQENPVGNNQNRCLWW